MDTPLVLLLALAAGSPPDCATVRADVAPLVAPLLEPARAIAAATNVQQAMPSLEPGKHYLVTLAPENRVAFIVAPARAARDDAPHGGILYLHVRVPGRYRIAIDTGHWIDVIDSGPHVLHADAARVVAASGHSDVGDCTALRKVVDFDLDAGTTYRIHLSGRGHARVNLVVARADD